MDDPSQFQSQQRFSNRVENYAKYRPSYPAEVFDFCREELGLVPDDAIADVGAGTGIFTQLLLAQGNCVLGVEPNPEMRRAMEEMLGDEPRFRSVSGSGEQTTLPDQSVDLVTVAQAFHWFDMPRVRKEFARILRPSRRVLLVWNDRKLTGTAFLEEYEQLLSSQLTDYRKVSKHTRVTQETVREFFTPGTMVSRTIPSNQKLDWQAFEGRTLSSSYVPAPEDPNHFEFMQRLKELFSRNEVDGAVTIEYLTIAFGGEVRQG